MRSVRGPLYAECKTAKMRVRVDGGSERGWRVQVSRWTGLCGGCVHGMSPTVGNRERRVRVHEWARPDVRRLRSGIWVDGDLDRAQDRPGPVTQREEVPVLLLAVGRELQLHRPERGLPVLSGDR